VCVSVHGCSSYSYYIEGSLDEKDWVRLVDHTRYLCRSWQNLRFSARVVRLVSMLSELYCLPVADCVLTDCCNKKWKSAHDLIGWCLGYLLAKANLDCSNL